MIPGCWIFDLEGDPGPSTISDLTAIPGVSALSPTRIAAPADAVAIVRGQLNGRPYEAHPQPDPIRSGIVSARTALPYLREWVPEFMLDYQRAGVAFALAAPGGSALLKHPTGSGKTLTEIVYGLCSPAPVIVVTRAAVRLQYSAEVERFTTITPTILASETPSAIPIGCRFMIMSYEILPAWITELERWAKECDPRPSVIFDEIHKLQGHRRWDATVGPDDRVKFRLRENIAAAAFRLSQVASRRLGGSATPIRDRVRNLWAQLDLIHPRAWGSYWPWARRYAGACEGTYGGMDDSGATNIDELRERLSIVCHKVSHAEANCLLPPLRRAVVRVPVAAQVRGGMIPEVRAALRRREPSALREALLMEAASRKRRWILERVEFGIEGGQKVIAFTGRRKDCEILREAVDRRLAGKCFITGGHGGDPVEVREAARVAYMEHPGPAVLIGTTDAWGESYNLHDTDLLIAGMLPWEPGKVLQMEGRVRRLGMKRQPLIMYPIADGTFDEHVCSLVLEKLPAVERVMEQDELSGFALELSGANDLELMESLAQQILAGLTKGGS